MLNKFCVSNEEMSFVQSTAFCNNIGAHFPQITSEEMNNVVSSIAKPIKCINKITQDEYRGCQVSSYRVCIIRLYYIILLPAVIYCCTNFNIDLGHR